MGRSAYWCLSALFILLASSLSIFITACNKSNNPLGEVAPQGFDYPTTTPTPIIGSVDVYVSDSNTAIQGVSIYLLDPSGNTSSVETTQPVVGYAAFNPPALTPGVWRAEVPAQSVSYVTTGPATIMHTYGTSFVPITITGGGQYAATFTTGGNSLSISPVTQAYAFSNPDFLAVTVTYSENGNLDVPVSVTLNGVPSIPAFTFQNPNNMILGGGTNFRAVTISKTACYSDSIALSLNAFDFSGVPVPTAGAEIGRDYSIPVTLSMDKTAIGSGDEYCSIQLDSANNCGASIYAVTYQMGTSNPSGGPVIGPVTIAAGQSVPVTYVASQDPYIRAVINYPGGQLVGDTQMQDLQFGTFTAFANSSY
jgi:hypothetical protein